MPASTSNSPRVAVLADSDTRWKWGALTASRLVTRPRIDGYLLHGRATPTPRQLQEVGFRADTLSEVTAVEFLREMSVSGDPEHPGQPEHTGHPEHARHPEPYGPFGRPSRSSLGSRNGRSSVGGGLPDVIVLALVGGAVQAVLHGLAHAWHGRTRRPVLVTGYVGVVYEKLADGLLLRHGADLVLANSRQDAERFRGVYEGVGADASCVTGTALPFLGGAPYTAPHEPYTVVFAAQPSVPGTRAERTYLLERLVGHARTHPDRRVVLKLRSRPGEHTTHIEELPYQRLAQRLGPLPANFETVHGHMGDVLDRTDLLVTVSSTAALESLHRGIPTAVLTDLGIRETLGNHHFLGSGCLTSFDRLDTGELPEPDQAWLARQGVAAGGEPGAYERAFAAARDRVAALLARDELPPPAPYYTAATAPGYLPGLLARHHLAPDGSPLPGTPAADRPPGPVRQVVRRAARGAYRHGVQRVAPVIRRMGDL